MLLQGWGGGENNLITREFNKLKLGLHKTFVAEREGQGHSHPGAALGKAGVALRSIMGPVPAPRRGASGPTDNR